MLKITRSAISRKLQPKKKKTRVLENIFLHLYTGFELKNQNTNGQKCLTFWTCVKSTLNGPPNEMTYQKYIKQSTLLHLKFLMQYINKSVL